MMNKRINNQFEIILCLIEEDFLHVRELERRTKINIKTLTRELKILTDLYILDYKSVGKNKHYFLKDTLESFNFEVMSEIYKSSKFLKKHKLLSVIMQDLHKQSDFAVFGSYANGSESKNSDIDIVMFSKETNNIRNILGLINKKVHLKKSTFVEFEKLVKEKQPLSLEILRNHVLFGKYKEFVVLRRWAKSSGVLKNMQ